MSGCPDLGLGCSSDSCFVRTSSLGFTRRDPIRLVRRDCSLVGIPLPPPKVILESNTQRVLCHPERRMKMKQGTWNKVFVWESTMD